MIGLYAIPHLWLTGGWEEVYVCIVEVAHVLLAIFHEIESPATLNLSTGNQVLWLRYAEWLLSCPVILIHLSNLTGECLRLPELPACCCRCLLACLLLPY